MKAIDNTVLERQLRWRYATKKFDSTRRIPQVDWDTLLNTLNLAPSSFGMQPWRFVVVEDLALRQELRKTAWNQSQITDASHLLVCAAKKRITNEDVDSWMNRISEVRSIPDLSLANYKQMIEGFISRPNFDTEGWSTHQVYLALGILLASAAMLGIDSCPMEGFEAGKFDHLLGLEQHGYSSKVVCALGYRAEDDDYAGQAKVRYDLTDIMVSM